MKRTIIIASFLVTFFSCSKADFMIESRPNTDGMGVINETKSIGYQSEDYFVEEPDIQAYIHFLETIRDEKSPVKVLNCEVVEENSVPVYYILNFENGWQLVSTDKRGPVVLGSSDSGSFSLGDRNPAELSWIAGLTDDIAFRRNCADDYYGKITQEALESEKGCLDFWKAITADPEFMESNIPATKSHPSHSSGHWELMFSIPTEIRDSIQHLLPTRWKQEHPFRKFVPQLSASDTAKCSVGCGAVAAAQVLYYLHYHFGKPQYSPTQGSCTGWPSNCDTTFRAFSSATWDSMSMTSDDGNQYTSLFIGHVAHNIHSHFGAETWSTFYRVKTGFEDTYGISSSFTNSYDSDIVLGNLTRHLPVIFRGGRNVSPGVYTGHAFVIDGYESTRAQIRLVYWWVYDSLPDPPVLIGDDDYHGNLIEYDYTAPVALNFRLNWGYGDTASSILDAKYSTDGIWSYPGRTPYQYNRRMLYDFEESN